MSHEWEQLHKNKLFWMTGLLGCRRCSSSMVKDVPVVMRTVEVPQIHSSPEFADIPVRNSGARTLQTVPFSAWGLYGGWGGDGGVWRFFVFFAPSIRTLSARGGGDAGSLTPRRSVTQVMSSISLSDCCIAFTLVDIHIVTSSTPFNNNNNNTIWGGSVFTLP